MRQYVIYAVLLVGFAAGLYSRFAALLLYLWIAIFRPLDWMFWVDVRAMRFSLIAGGLLVIPCLLTGILPKVTHPLSIGSLVFLGTALNAHRNAIRPDLSWQWIDYLARMMLVSFLMIRLVTTERRFTAVVAVIAGSLAFHSAKGGVAYLLSGGQARINFGLGGAFQDNDSYALAVVMVLPFLLASAQNIESRWLRTGLLLAVPLSCLSVIATFARGAFLALASSAAAMVMVQRRRVASVTVLMTLGVLAVLVVPEGYFERMRTISTYQEVGETSALSRLFFWRIAWNMARDHPLGIGLRNYEPLYDSYDPTNGLYGRERAVHSSHFQVLAENGFVGFAAWLFLFSYSYLVLFRIRRRSRSLTGRSASFYFTMSNALIVSQSAFLVGGAFYSQAHNDLTWYSFGLVAALDYLQRAADRTVPAQAAAGPAQSASPVGWLRGWRQ